MYICMYIRIQICIIHGIHYDHQGALHDDMSSFGDNEVVVKTKSAVNFDGFYCPCPSAKQCSTTRNLRERER